jgi:hypothetical protein
MLGSAAAAWDDGDERCAVTGCVVNEAFRVVDVGDELCGEHVGRGWRR